MWWQRITMSRPFPTSSLWIFLDWLGNKTAIPEKYSIHVLSLQCGFLDRIHSRSAFNLARLWFRDPPSLFMNGALFLQIRLPFWVGIQIRPFTERYFQAGLGFKGNSRFAMGFYWVIFWPVLCLLFGWSWWYLTLLAMIRFQTDESSAAGMDFQNHSQATYMNDGGK